jgi:hypothetical protein
MTAQDSAAPGQEKAATYARLARQRALQARPHPRQRWMLLPETSAVARKNRGQKKNPAEAGLLQTSS